MVGVEEVGRRLTRNSKVKIVKKYPNKFITWRKIWPHLNLY